MSGEAFMRRSLLMAAVAAAVAVIGPTAAQAATITIPLGDSEYGVTVNPSPPSGSLAASGNTISASCTVLAISGNPLQEPNCTTRTITCPTSAFGCDAIFTLQESALSGPVNVNGVAHFSGQGSGGTYHITQDTCPGASSCSGTVVFTGMSPGATVSANYFNTAANPTLPIVSGQVNVDVNS